VSPEPHGASALAPDLEHRSVIELRADRQRIVGYALVFDVRSRDLGGFCEIVRSQAVGAMNDVVALYNHEPGAVLGRTPQTLQLTKDDRGLAFVLDPAPTQAGRDAFELVKRGDITGASFGFRTKKDTWRKDTGRKDTADNMMVRELLDIELVEISLTAFPAYRETDVSIAQRSLLAATHQGSPTTLKPVSWLRLQARTRS
jgi:HK97 family phage prohead protease